MILTLVVDHFTLVNIFSALGVSKHICETRHFLYNFTCFMLSNLPTFRFLFQVIECNKTEISRCFIFVSKPLLKLFNLTIKLF